MNKPETITNIRRLLSEAVPVYCIHAQTDVPIAEIEQLKTRMEFEARMAKVKATLDQKKGHPWRRETK